MTYKEVYQTIVDKETMLYQIVPYNLTGLPSNSVFFKGRCGIGGSTLEMLKERHSIISVPTVAPIKGKCQQFVELITERNKRHLFNDMFGIMGEEGTTRKKRVKLIEQELSKADKYIKLITTTDSFDCIIEAARNLGKLEWLYENFFLLLDECHCFVTEAFRPNITIPFRYFWSFTNKCLISATPFVFSDPAFAKLDKHEIIINEKLGEIELIDASDINGVVHFILTHPEKFPGNVHIFYNSITQLSERVKNAIIDIGEIHCNIFCSKSDENIKKLGELAHLFKEEPKAENYKKFNFYTSRYTEAWDLHDTNATIILITDVNARHTKVGITNKGVQAIGRIRSKPHRIIHFTNHLNIDWKQSTEHFKKKHKLYADNSIEAFNIHARKAKALKMPPYSKMFEAAEKYAEVAIDGYSAELEYIKIDQWVNLDVCSEEYNHLKFIRQAWEASNYSVHLRVLRPSTIPDTTNMLVENQLKLAFERIDKLERNKHNMLFSDDFADSQNEIIGVNKNFELMYKAYYCLGPARVQQIGFSKAKIKKALIVATESAMKRNALQELKKKIGNKLPISLSNKEAKKQLLDIYNNIGYKSNCTGTEIDDYCSNLKRNKLGVRIYSLKDELID